MIEFPSIDKVEVHEIEELNVSVMTTDIDGKTLKYDA